MVYQQKFIAVIKTNNKILREQEENTVYLPFNSEYEILLKNLESRDASVKITIDGIDILDNNSIILRANTSTSLQGFLKNNQVTHKFKFIQKTEKISNFRGDRVDDGLIRVEYRFTKLKQTITTYHEHFYHPVWCACQICHPWKRCIHPHVITPTIYYGSAQGTAGGLADSSKNVTFSSNSSLENSQSSSSGGEVVMDSIPKQDEGITVKGSRSNQQFVDSSLFELDDQSYTIILKLRGYFQKLNKPVETPILVSTKITCSTCGKANDSKHQFCPECGTALY